MTITLMRTTHLQEMLDMGTSTDIITTINTITITTTIASMVRITHLQHMLGMSSSLSDHQTGGNPCQLAKWRLLDNQSFDNQADKIIVDSNQFAQWRHLDN